MRSPKVHKTSKSSKTTNQPTNQSRSDKIHETPKQPKKHPKQPTTIQGPTKYMKTNLHTTQKSDKHTKQHRNDQKTRKTTLTNPTCHLIKGYERRSYILTKLLPHLTDSQHDSYSTQMSHDLFNQSKACKKNQKMAA